MFKKLIKPDSMVYARIEVSCRKDCLIEEVFQREKKNYIRKTERIDKIVTKDLSKSAAVASFQKKLEEKSSFPTLFRQK